MRLARVALLWLTCLGAIAVLDPAVAAEAGNWTTDGNGAAGQRYSPLDRINERNVKSLGLD